MKIHLLHCLLVLPFCFFLLSCQGKGPKKWYKEWPYACNDSLRFGLKIEQETDPFPSTGINGVLSCTISYYASIEVFLIDPYGLTRNSGAVFELIYQCALCAPAKLAEGNEGLRFRLSDFFETKKEAKRLFLTFDRWEKLERGESDELFCLKSRTVLLDYEGEDSLY